MLFRRRTCGRGVRRLLRNPLGDRGGLLSSEGPVVPGWEAGHDLSPGCTSSGAETSAQDQARTAAWHPGAVTAACSRAEGQRSVEQAQGCPGRGVVWVPFPETLGVSESCVSFLYMAQAERLRPVIVSHEEMTVTFRLLAGHRQFPRDVSPGRAPRCGPLRG